MTHKEIRELLYSKMYEFEHVNFHHHDLINATGYSFRLHMLRRKPKNHTQVDPELFFRVEDKRGMLTFSWGYHHAYIGQDFTIPYRWIESIDFEYIKHHSFGATITYRQYKDMPLESITGTFEF